MQTVLFHSTIFGPIHSRRLGSSLGVNLSPSDGKTCTFDCLYCEAGYNAQGPGTTGLPPRETVATLLEARLQSMKANGEPLDVITFSGNGEPTMHPAFEGIIDDTIALRDKYFPGVKVSVLCNSTLLTGRDDVVRALLKVDNAIVKLDSAIDTTLAAIDRPNRPSFTPAEAIEGIKRLDHKCIVQTMLLRGTAPDGTPVDNTTPAEVEALTAAIKDINPAGVMLYSIDRKTPCTTLQKVERDEIEAIAARMRDAGISNIQVN